MIAHAEPVPKVVEETSPRRRKNEHRRNNDAVLKRCRHLDEPDELLLRQVLGHGVGTNEVAAVSGVCRRTVQRRVRRLTRRLSNPVVVQILRSCRYWSDTTRDVAVARWVRGRTLYETAADLGMTLHQVRQEAQVVRGLLAQRAEVAEVRDQRSEVSEESAAV